MLQNESISTVITISFLISNRIRIWSGSWTRVFPLITNLKYSLEFSGPGVKV